MEPCAASPLVTIPVEILEGIASYLSGNDFGALRLTCKAVEQMLFDQFARQFFREMKFLMPGFRCPSSLRTLAEIAAHPTLSKSLQHVTLTTNPQVSWQFPLDDSFGRLPRAYPGSVLDLKPTDDFGHGFGAAGDDRPILAGIFSGLANLKTVSMRDTSLENSWGYDNRPSRDDSQASEDPDMEQRYPPRFNDHVFAVTLAALADACARPETLDAWTNAYGGLNDFAFHIPGYLKPSLTPVLLSIRKLNLVLAFCYNERDTVASDGWVGCLCLRFISLAQILLSLRLRFWGSCGGPSSTGFLASLGRRAGTTQLASCTNIQGGGSTTCLLPMLQRLEMHYIEPGVPPAVLRDIVRKFSPTLRTLKLSRVRLLDERNPVDARVNIWKPLLKSIARECNLTEWSFYQLAISFAAYGRVIVNVTTEKLLALRIEG
ncbi:hypothetical protein NKR19_g3057 [Coniochaeta hoffmannii]|uniref:F-box domain-containing protein n=1 Tax=Coniochaeta hoffmannii TaxID=91930 RepID=A0AA38RWU9_9PEZI|nr:hypothetical protein NKR19_g3057 [Coniochaeta hoffmannii]